MSGWSGWFNVAGMRPSVKKFVLRSKRVRPVRSPKAAGMEPVRPWSFSLVTRGGVPPMPSSSMPSSSMPSHVSIASPTAQSRLTNGLVPIRASLSLSKVVQSTTKSLRSGSVPSMLASIPVMAVSVALHGVWAWAGRARPSSSRTLLRTNTLAHPQRVGRLEGWPRLFCNSLLYWGGGGGGG